MKPSFVIHIQPQAAPKPASGAPCNGCGVCCLSEPCPLGMLLSHRRTGACAAVRWDAVANQYRCGAMVDATTVLHQALPPGLRWLASATAPLLRRLARRWIAAGQGCDSDLAVQGPAGSQSDRQSPS
ncbi:hypothetical protein [Curvibacter delicatus]|uniref:hypothetical protein n=1 Tax=Curvibacter delicatus TaxID=80879 RepID=UPI000830A231|nr:hypothetical protein [Curvibacter delicatus]